MDYTELFKKVRDHVNLFYIDHTDARLLYHNQVHAKEIAEAAVKIAEYYKSDERTRFIVFTAAWFHDTGYLVTGALNHEIKSAELAASFLVSIMVSEEDIAEVQKCIMATKMPQNPVSLAEKIVCDADLFYLGTEAFQVRSKLLRKERENLENVKISGTQWREQSIAFLQSHHYHTDYCQMLLDKTKADNLVHTKITQEKKILETTLDAGAPEAATIEFEKITGNNKIPEQPGNLNAGKGKKPERPIRGVETMFRVSSANHLRLSVMADNKAHIMISVNSIIVSVALGLVVRKLDTDKNLRNLIIPTCILLLVNIITIIYSVLATRPNIPNGVFTPEQLEKKTVNLMFFGSFYKMQFHEYENGMKKMMNDSEFLYGSLIKDIYWQGRVLGRKYSLLRTSYNVFMYGIAIAVVAYAIAVFI